MNKEREVKPKKINDKKISGGRIVRYKTKLTYSENLKLKAIHRDIIAQMHYIVDEDYKDEVKNNHKFSFSNFKFDKDNAEFDLLIKDISYDFYNKSLEDITKKEQKHLNTTR